MILGPFSTTMFNQNHYSPFQQISHTTAVPDIYFHGSSSPYETQGWPSNAYQHSYYHTYDHHHYCHPHHYPSSNPSPYGFDYISAKMGTSLNSKHKRRATDGMKKAWRKKHKYELGRRPTITKLSNNKTIRRIRVGVSKSLEVEHVNEIVCNGAYKMFDNCSAKDLKSSRDDSCNAGHSDCGVNQIFVKSSERPSVFESNLLEFAHSLKRVEELLQQMISSAKKYDIQDEDPKLGIEGEYDVALEKEKNIDNDAVQVFEKTPKKEETEVSNEVQVFDEIHEMEETEESNNDEVGALDWDRIYALICSDYEVEKKSKNKMYQVFDEFPQKREAELPVKLYSTNMMESKDGAKMKSLDVGSELQFDYEEKNRELLNLNVRNIGDLLSELMASSELILYEGLTSGLGIDVEPKSIKESNKWSTGIGGIGIHVIERLEEEAEMNKRPVKYAWVLDKLKVERERGMTFDIALWKFEMTEYYSITMIDAPGHRDLIMNMIAGTPQADYVLPVIDSTTGGSVAGITKDGQTCKLTLLTFTLDFMEIICYCNKMDATTPNYSKARGIDLVQGKIGDRLCCLGCKLPKVTDQFEEIRSIKIIQGVDQYIMWLQYHNFGIVTCDLLDTGQGTNGLNALSVQLASDTFLKVFMCLDFFPLEISVYVKELLAEATKEHNEYVDCVVLVSMLWFSAALVGSGSTFVLEVFGYVHCKSWWQIAYLEGAYSVAVQSSFFCKEVDEGIGVSWYRNNIDKEYNIYLAKVATTSVLFYNIMVSGVALETRVKRREIEQQDNIESLLGSLVLDLLLFYHESMVEHMIFVIVRVYFLTVEVDEIGHESAMKPSLTKDDNSGAIPLIYSLEQKTNESVLESDGDPISGNLFLPFVGCDFEVVLCSIGVPHFEDYFQPYSVVDRSRAASKKKYWQGCAQAVVVSLSVWLCCEIILQALQWWNSKPPTVGVTILSKHVNNDNDVLIELIEEVFTLLKGSGFVGGLHPRAVLNAFVVVLIGRRAKELTNSAIPRYATIPQPQEYALVGSDATLSSFCLVQVVKPHPREREGSTVKVCSSRLLYSKWISFKLISGAK